MKWERLRKEPGEEGTWEFGVLTNHAVTSRCLYETGGRGLAGHIDLGVIRI